VDTNQSFDISNDHQINPALLLGSMRLRAERRSAQSLLFRT
jgi:hypothetical protein